MGEGSASGANSPKGTPPAPAGDTRTGSNHNNSSSGSHTTSSSGGGHWYSRAWHATTHYVSEHKGTIANIVVASVTFAGCEFATGGVGTVGCAALAGAAGNAAQYAVDTPKDQWSASGFVKSSVEGAIYGAAGGEAGMVVSRVAGPLLWSQQRRPNSAAPPTAPCPASSRNPSAWACPAASAPPPPS